MKKRADKTLYVVNQMSMSDFLKCPLVSQESPSESLFRFCSVLFGPGLLTMEELKITATEK